MGAVQLIAIMVTIAFFGLSVMHIFWAVGGKRDSQKFIPADNGKPVFTPGLVGTLLVAVILAGFAALGLALGFKDAIAEAYQPYAKYAGFVVGAVLILRAIGEFRYAGFFKRVRGSEFATYDDFVYSPFCLLAGTAFFYLAANPS